MFGERSRTENENGKSFVCSDSKRKGKYPAILKLSAATYGDYNQNENKALLDECMFIKNTEVNTGDLLFTRKNTPELVGMAAYVFETERLQSLKIPVPPLALQEKFAEFVRAVDAEKALAQKSLNKSETLYKALMQQYFA